MEQIYDLIAKDFDRTRYSVWRRVKEFLDKIPDNYILDIGCGNGKNMINKNMEGIDISQGMIKICLDKGLKVKKSSMTNILYNDNQFDNFICVAAYHHLLTDIEKKDCLSEMNRILKKGGKGLIVVWAVEQEEGSRFNFHKEINDVPWRCKDGRDYIRKYYVYEKDMLKEEILRLSKFKVLDYYLDKGNWYIEVQS